MQDMIDIEGRARLRQIIEQHDYVQPISPISDPLSSDGVICVYHMTATAPIESTLVDTWQELMPVIADYAGSIRVMPIRGSATMIRAMLFLEDDKFRKARWEFNEGSR